MERLTKIDGCGQNDLIRCFDCGLEKAGENLENCGYCSEGWQRALNRLAAYEDTGLEPEEINDMALEVATLKTIESMYDGLGNPDHLRDLLQAEQDGRLVVLPCKVGDTVYTVQQVGRGHWEEDKYILDDRGTPKVYEKKFSLILLEYIGKTVFLTREEAEAALAGERKDGKPCTMCPAVPKEDDHA